MVRMNQTKTLHVALFGVTLYKGEHPKWARLPSRLNRWRKDVYHWFLYRLDPGHRAYWNPRLFSPRYTDPDTVMLHGMMHALGLYIKEAGGVERLEKFTRELEGEEDPNNKSPHQAAAQREALTIWHWWTVDRLEREKRHEEGLDEFRGWRFNEERKKMTEEERAAHITRTRRFLREWRQREAADEALVDEMILRLVEIRGFLWR